MTANAPKRLLSLLRDYDRDCAELEKAHAALNAQHAAKWPAERIELLDLAREGWAAAGAPVDERPPAPEKPARKPPRASKPAPPALVDPALLPEEIDRLLAMSIPVLAKALKGCPVAHLDQLLARLESAGDDPATLARRQTIRGAMGAA